MVSDNRERSAFRVCPTAEDRGDRSAIFQQHITESTCFRRQERSYHKCHKCVYHEAARIRQKLVPISRVV